MQPKKNPNSDLRNYSRLLLAFGLCIVLFVKVSVVALPTNDYCGPGVTKGAWSQGLVEGMDSQNYGCDVYGTTFGFSEKVNSIPNREAVGDLNGIDEPFGEPSEVFIVISDHANHLWGKALELGIHFPFNQYYSWWLCQGFYSGAIQSANFEKYLVDKDGFVVKLKNLSDNPESVIDSYVSYLSENVPQALEESDTDLLNLRDEMLAILNQTKYRLHLM